jgi:hypothetical protein
VILHVADLHPALRAPSLEELKAVDAVSEQLASQGSEMHLRTGRPVMPMQWAQLS